MSCTAGLLTHRQNICRLLTVKAPVRCSAAHHLAACLPILPGRAGRLHPPWQLAAPLCSRQAEGCMPGLALSSSFAWLQALRAPGRSASTREAWVWSVPCSAPSVMHPSSPARCLNTPLLPPCAWESWRWRPGCRLACSTSSQVDSPAATLLPRSGQSEIVTVTASHTAATHQPCPPSQARAASAATPSPPTT